jgi:cytochrome b involved in lipid metabolism
MALVFKVLRASAWLLVLATLLTLLSGFSTTKYFLFPWLGYNFSYYVHTVIVPLVFAPLFYLHSLLGLFSLMMRHKFLNHRYLKIIFGIIWTSFFVAFGWFYLAKNPASAVANQKSDAAVVSINLTTEEIAKHNSAGDCWMIIDGKVYDLTNYLSVHPGGAGAMIPYCGKDGSRGFATKDKGTPHSQNAANLLNSFYLGNVGGTVSEQVVQNIQSQPVQSGGGEFEDD